MILPASVALLLLRRGFRRTITTTVAVPGLRRPVMVVDQRTPENLLTNFRRRSRSKVAPPVVCKDAATGAVVGALCDGTTVHVNCMPDPVYKSMADLPPPSRPSSLDARRFSAAIAKADADAGADAGTDAIGSAPLREIEDLDPQEIAEMRHLRSTMPTVWTNNALQRRFAISSRDVARVAPCPPARVAALKFVLRVQGVNPDPAREHALLLRKLRRSMW